LRGDGKPSPSLRATGSPRECAPDDRLREAIHSTASGEMDCFAALAMTADIVSCSRDMNCPRFASSFAPEKSEGAGKTGCLLHPRSRVRFAQTKLAHEHTGQRETLRPSLRNGFTAYFVLFPENGSFASVACASYRTLSASTATPEPHDFAVRFRRVRLSRPQRPPHLTARS
jgi:hypothetical protein